MDLVRGGTLAERIHSRGPMEARLLAALMHQILLGLHHVHDQGMVHRDMKPHNVLIDGTGRAILSDFGLARAFDDEQFLTRPRATMGTMGYIAPEQEIDARRVDHRTDLYGAGATLFMCLTGKEPEALHRAGRDDAQLAPLPAPLADVIFKATRLQPDERYQTAVEMADALGKALELLPAAEGAEATPIADTRGMNSAEVLGRRLKFDALEPKRMVVGGGGARERALAHNQRIAAEKRRNLGLILAAAVLLVVALIAWFALRPAAP
jgi:serine/threonine protein kinase